MLRKCDKCLKRHLASAGEVPQQVRYRAKRGTSGAEVSGSGSQSKATQAGTQAPTLRHMPQRPHYARTGELESWKLEAAA